MLSEGLARGPPMIGGSLLVGSPIMEGPLAKSSLSTIIPAQKPYWPGSLTNPHGIKPTNVLGSPPQIGHWAWATTEPRASSANKIGDQSNVLCSSICSSFTSALEIFRTSSCWSNFFLSTMVSLRIFHTVRLV